MNNLFGALTHTSSHDLVCIEITVLHTDSPKTQTTVDNPVLDADCAPKIHVCLKDVDTTKYSEQVSVKLADSTKQCSTPSELLEYYFSFIRSCQGLPYNPNIRPAAKKNI